MEEGFKDVSIAGTIESEIGDVRGRCLGGVLRRIMCFKDGEVFVVLFVCVS